MKKSQPKKPMFAARKKAFDSVLKAYRSAEDNSGGIGAMLISAGGKGVMNPARPTLSDFRSDVDKVIDKCIPRKQEMLRLRFKLAYIQFDSESSIDCEVFAEQVMGSMRHNLEQGMGALFISRGVFPLYGRGGYFRSIRQPRGAV